MAEDFTTSLVSVVRLASARRLKPRDSILPSSLPCLWRTARGRMRGRPHPPEHRPTRKFVDVGHFHRILCGDYIGSCRTRSIRRIFCGEYGPQSPHATHPAPKRTPPAQPHVKRAAWATGTVVVVVGYAPSLVVVGGLRMSKALGHWRVGPALQAFLGTAPNDRSGRRPCRSRLEDALDPRQRPAAEYLRGPFSATSHFFPRLARVASEAPCYAAFPFAVGRPCSFGTPDRQQWGEGDAPRDAPRHW